MPEQRPVTDILTRGVGAQGRGKRQFFNRISVIMVLSAAVAGGLLGYTWFDCFGAVLGLVVAGGGMSMFVVSQRYYR